MSEEAAQALERLIAAFQEHYVVARAAGDVDNDALEAAEEALRDAFFTYDDELFTRFGVELPFDLLDDDFDDEDEDDDEDAEDADVDDDDDDSDDDDFDDDIDMDDDFIDVDDE